MTMTFSRTGALRAAAFGAVALFFGTLAVPLPAQAAFVRDFNLGNISVPNQAWNPAQDRVGLSVWFNQDGPGLSGQNTTSVGYATWKAPYKQGAPYTINYRFSVYDKANLTISGVGLEYGGDSRTLSGLTLTGPDGRIVRTSTGGNIPIVTNMAGGDYVLSITGYAPETSMAYIYYSMRTIGGSPLPSPGPGEVPLPGALLLLGTALAGAGVYGRRKVNGAKAA